MKLNPLPIAIAVAIGLIGNSVRTAAISYLVLILIGAFAAVLDQIRKVK